MKAILISIKPKYVADILKGNKTLEIRKSKPGCDLSADVYIYCTNDNHIGYVANKYVGKVVAKFTLNTVSRINWINHSYIFESGDIEHACLTMKELHQYLCGVSGYAWHIDNLEIFKQPKNLSDFKVIAQHRKPQNLIFKRDNTLTRPPQSYCYVEV